MGKESRVLIYYLSNKEDLDFLFIEESEIIENEEVVSSFSESIRAKKDTTTYNAHSYPTKVPPEGIIPFLNHYVKDGDKVLDPFCGSGMTGLATKLLARKHSKKVDIILNDLGVAATHISFNYNNEVDHHEFERQYKQIRKKLDNFQNEMYKTFHIISKNAKYENIKLSQLEKSKVIDDSKDIRELKSKDGNVLYVNANLVTTIWSEVYSCLSCKEELNLWKVAMNPKTGKMAQKFSCPNCKKVHERSDFAKPLDHKISYLIYEYICPLTNKVKRHERNASQIDLDVYEKYQSFDTKKWYPKNQISEKREMMTMGPAKLGIKKVSDFYTKRNLNVCAEIWHEIENVKNERVRSALMFAATNTFWHATRMRRFNVKGGMRPLTGTLYIPQISAECNVFKVLDKKVNELCKFYETHYGANKAIYSRSYHVNESATNLQSIPEASIDYIFTDPPFGGNIYYSDCNVIWEGWLGKLTDDKEEILFNRSRKPKDGGKTREDYHNLMNQAFSEMFRVLKPGKWASIVFNNSDNDVLEGFVNSAKQAGFEIADVNFFDKDQKSVKGYMGQKGIQNVTNLDIVLNVRKPSNLEKINTRKAKVVTDQMLFKLIDNYLKKLPSLMKKNASVYTEEHRTLPFLHSMLLRHFIKNNFDLKELTLDRIAKICSENELSTVNLKNNQKRVEGRVA